MTDTPTVLEKDYLNVKEAALYMGLSLSGFQKMACLLDIPCGKVPKGKKVYRRCDLATLNEQYFNAQKLG
jgi:hypothetical protein